MITPDASAQFRTLPLVARATALGWELVNAGGTYLEPVRDQASLGGAPIRFSTMDAAKSAARTAQAMARGLVA